MYRLKMFIKKKTIQTNARTVCETLYSGVQITLTTEP